jgi:hypothetical protein
MIESYPLHVLAMREAAPLGQAGVARTKLSRADASAIDLQATGPQQSPLSGCRS